MVDEKLEEAARINKAAGRQELALAKTLDITPTWQGILPTLVAVAAHGETPEARKVAMDELMKLARIVDERIGDLEKLREQQDEP